MNYYEKPFDPHRPYNILSREIIERIDFSHVKENIELFVDKCKGRNERALFDSFIKNNLEPLLPINISINIQHKLSHDLAGLQAVDLFCYGISRKHALNDRQWYQIFSRHITEEITWKAKLA